MSLTICCGKLSIFPEFCMLKTMRTCLSKKGCPDEEDADCDKTVRKGFERGGGR